MDEQKMVFRLLNNPTPYRVYGELKLFCPKAIPLMAKSKRVM